MGTLDYCRNYEQATVVLGVVVEYIDIERKHGGFIEGITIKSELEGWVEENLEGKVAFIFEREFGKDFMTLFFQHKEDAMAFKLCWL